MAYGAMSAYGMYMLISWLLNAAHDVSWLLFRSNPYVVSAVWESWDSPCRYLTLGIFLVLFSIVHHSMRRNQTKQVGMASSFSEHLSKNHVFTDLKKEGGM